MIFKTHIINKSIKRGLVFLLMLLPFIGFAQNSIETDISLAEQFYENGEVDKALELYESVYERTSFQNVYKALVGIYLKKEDFKAAESLVKKRMRGRNDAYRYEVDLGNVYRKQGNDKKANQSFESAIKEVPDGQSNYISLANDFAAIAEYDFAIEVYEKAKKSTGDDIQYNFQLANIYGRKGNTEAMIDQYLDVLAVNESYLQSIQNVLQTLLNPDPNGEIKEKLKNNLLGRIQKSPDKTIYTELLIWQFIQDKNFSGAFIQARAIDRRQNENGTRIFSLAQLAASNQDYDVAIQCYNYILEKGPSAIYYSPSRIRLVDVLKEKILSTNNYTLEELLKVDVSYRESLKELGKNRKTVELMGDYAHFLAFYLDSSDAAIELLNTAINIPGAARPDVAECKIELADVYVTQGEIWEASLLYSQVEKEFKYDEIGERAKFKNAKIAYYTGDFFWSQAQLNALKGSTSKLISNDAIDLSLLITDNVGVDSIIEPLQIYARAELLLFQNKSAEALVTLDSIPERFPAASLNDEILYLKYKIAYKRKEYDAAADYLRKLISTYALDILGDDAYFYLAKLTEEQLNNPEKAMELYKSILTDYSSSIHVVEARKRFRALRGDAIN